MVTELSDLPISAASLATSGCRSNPRPCVNFPYSTARSCSRDQLWYDILPLSRNVLVVGLRPILISCISATNYSYGRFPFMKQAVHVLLQAHINQLDYFGEMLMPIHGRSKFRQLHIRRTDRALYRR